MDRNELMKKFGLPVLIVASSLNLNAQNIDNTKKTDVSLEIGMNLEKKLIGSIELRHAFKEHTMSLKTEQTPNKDITISLGSEMMYSENIDLGIVGEYRVGQKDLVPMIGATGKYFEDSFEINAKAVSNITETKLKASILGYTALGIDIGAEIGLYGRQKETKKVNGQQILEKTGYNWSPSFGVKARITF